MDNNLKIFYFDSKLLDQSQKMRFKIMLLKMDVMQLYYQSSKKSVMFDALKNMVPKNSKNS